VCNYISLFKERILQQQVLLISAGMLLRWHRSDGIVDMGRLSVATVGYAHATVLLCSSVRNKVRVYEPDSSHVDERG
jgi:hypothetical protein